MKYWIISSFVFLMMSVRYLALEELLLNENNTSEYKKTVVREQLNTAMIVENLSLEDAVNFAIKNNRELNIMSIAKKIAAGKVMESYGQALPGLTINAGYNRLDSVNTIKFGDKAVEIGSEDNYFVELTARQPIYHGDAIPSAIKIAKLYSLQTEENIRVLKRKLIFQVIQEYYGVILAEEILNVRAKAMEYAENFLEDVKKKRISGVATEYDVLRARVEVSNAKTLFIQQKNNLDIAYLRLIKTLGFPLECNLKLTDKLDYKPYVIDFDTAFKTAIEIRGEILSLKYAIRMQEEALRIAKSAYIPALDAFFNYRLANPSPHSAMDKEWDNSWTAGISLNFTLFDGFSRRGKIVQEEARLEQLKLELENLKETIKLELREAINNLNNADEMFASQKLNLERAEEAIKLVYEGYRLGSKTYLEVLDAQTAFTNAKALFFESIYRCILARANVEQVIGRLNTENLKSIFKEN